MIMIITEVLEKYLYSWHCCSLKQMMDRRARVEKSCDGKKAMSERVGGKYGMGEDVKADREDKGNEGITKHYRRDEQR